MAAPFNDPGELDLRVAIMQAEYLGNAEEVERLKDTLEAYLVTRGRPAVLIVGQGAPR